MTTFEDLVTLTTATMGISDERFAWELLTSRKTESGQEYVYLFKNAAYILANSDIYVVDADGKGYDIVEPRPASTEEDYQRRTAAGNALLETFRDDIEAMYQDALRADTANRDAVYGR